VEVRERRRLVNFLTESIKTTGKITLTFGVAPIRPAEFITVTIEHDTAQ
jgi:phage tail sheath protein FI